MLDLLVRKDPVLAPFLPASRREEPLDLTYGINLDYASALEEAGLRPAGFDAVTNRPYLFVFEPNRWHVTAAFLPQMASEPGRPHPLFIGPRSRTPPAASRAIDRSRLRRPASS